MKNKELARDYIVRAGNRLAAVDVLFEKQSYADVVRECQELVELCLNGVLNLSGSDDLIPSDFYKEDDAKKALDDARWLYSICEPLLSTK